MGGDEFPLNSVAAVEQGLMTVFPKYASLDICKTRTRFSFENVEVSCYLVPGHTDGSAPP
jgi:hypothetical protein